MKVRTNMTRNITTLSPGESLAVAYDLMKDNEIRHLPVVDECNRLVGMLSERDILLYAAEEDNSVEVPDVSVSEVMSTDVISCRPTSEMAAVACTMLERKIDAMPVTLGDGELVGIVTSADFLALAAEKLPMTAAPNIPFNFVLNRFQPEQHPRKYVNIIRNSHQ